MIFVAVIGDLVGSRKIPAEDRRTTQLALSDYFEQLEPGDGTGIWSQPTITLGDEFQGLFSAAHEPGRIVRFLTDVQDLCRPTKVRFGIGLGSLTTDLRSISIGMDGPCFHRARSAIEDYDPELPCRVRGGEPLIAEMLTFLLSDLLCVREGWTSEQREAVELYTSLNENERSWSRVAEILGRSPSAITQRQQGARWKLVRGLTELTTRGLVRLQGTVEGADE